VVDAADVLVPALVAVASAAATYLLGRHAQRAADEDRAYVQAWRLVEELRSEVDRLHKQVADLEAHVAAQDRQHARDRERWAVERRALIAAFRRGDDTPPPSPELAG
jgi:hypothetical protein